MSWHWFGIGRKVMDNEKHQEPETQPQPDKPVESPILQTQPVETESALDDDLTEGAVSEVPPPPAPKQQRHPDLNPKAKKPKEEQTQTEELSAVMEILTAIRKLEGKGLSREQVIVLTADQMYASRKWKERKAAVRKILFEIIKVSESIE